MSYHHFTLKERKKIAHLYREKYGIREISQILKRNPSSISREIKRNGEGRQYNSTTANEKYYRRRERCRRKKKYLQTELVSYISEKLEMAWSPEQISGAIKWAYPENHLMRISFHSIYRWLEEGLLPRAVQLKRNLRFYGKHYGETRGHQVGVRELKTRCKEALKRTTVGHWEVDTIMFRAGIRGRGYMLNMTDRKSRYCCLCLLRSTSKKDVMRAFTFCIEGRKLPIKTMTSDQGNEFKCHLDFEEKYNALFYFARPASPWQKPTVENTNGLIRQFFPRGIDFHEIEQDDVAKVMDLLNNRPRKCLGWRTPAEILSHDCCT